MNLETKDGITQELDAILIEKHRNWVHVGLVLSAVRHTNFLPGKPNFSAWLEGWGVKANLGKATLWRYITAQEKYTTLKQDAEKYGYYFPDLDKLDDPISPEGIEIFQKLMGVLEASEVFEMMESFIDGRVTRKELRDKWRVYKATLPQKKSRLQMLQDDTPDYKKYSIPESALLDGLRIEGSKWLLKQQKDDIKSVAGCPEPVFFKFFQDVKMKQNNHVFLLDAVLGFKKNTKTALQIHGVETVEKALAGHSVEQYRKCCNYFWIAMPEEFIEGNIRNHPKGVGLLTIKNKKVEVLIEATVNDSPELLVDLLKELLIRWKSA